MTAHSHDHAEPANDEPRLDRHGNVRPRYDDINTPVVVLVGVISTVLTVLIIAFVQGLCLQWQNNLVDLNSRSVANQGVEDVLDAQKKKLLGEPTSKILGVAEVVPDVLEKYKQSTHAASQNEAPHASTPQEETQH